MSDAALEENRAIQVADDLLDLDHDRTVRAGDDLDRTNRWIDDAPLPSPAAGTNLFVGIALFGALILLPLYFQIVRGESPLATGLLLAPQGLGAALAMPIAGRLTDQVGARVVVPAGILLALVGTLAYTQVGADTSYMILAGALFVIGLGLGSTIVPSMAVAYRSVPRESVAQATSTINVIQRVAASVGTALLAIVLQRTIAASLPSVGAALTGVPEQQRAGCTRSRGCFRHDLLGCRSPRRHCTPSCAAASTLPSAARACSACLLGMPAEREVEEAALVSRRTFGKTARLDLPSRVPACDDRGVMTDANVLTRMLHAIDALDWATVRDSFADEVATDYTSLWGGEPEKIRAENLIRQWQEFTAGLNATQHLTGPVVLSNERAETHVVAYHWLPDGDCWIVHGHYVARISGGKIAELTLQTFHAGGHDGLPAIAGQRPGMRT